MRAYRFLLIAAIAVTAVAGCRKHERPERQNPGEGGNQEQGREQQVVTLKENKTWSIEYGGRQLVQGTKVEIINVTKVPANTLYLVSVINRENYSTYEGKLKEFLEAELEYAVQNDYIYSGDQTIQFDPFRHGTWYAFIIGIDSDKKLTGEYAYLKFTVEEEEPTEDYLKWIGNWTATDGKFTYNLKVSQLEANFIYRVDGWEVFDGADVEMNLEYLETFYDGGDMYFTSQYITSYEDTDLNGVVVDECFLGEIDYDGILFPQGLYMITDENIDLACASLSGEDKAVIQPCAVTAVMSDNEKSEDFDTVFHDMKYFYWNTSTSVWYAYNDMETMGFPVTMTRASDNPAPNAIGRRGLATSKNATRALRGNVHKAKTQRAKAILAR